MLENKIGHDEKEIAMSKKANMAYWDAIDGLTEDYLRALLEFSHSPLKLVDEEEDEDNAVENMMAENASHNAIYNLQGQRLDSLPTSGIVIVNNKKQLMK